MKPALVIIGLGNPGEEYAATRHNVGWQALDQVAQEFGEGDWKDMQKFLAKGLEARLVTAPVLLLKPQTFMNLSGNAVKKVVDFYKLKAPSQIIVLTDDVDLPLGEVRFRQKGGSGTHNGLKSIEEAIGNEYPRLRIGLGSQPSGTDLATWVLSRFSPDEKVKIEKAVEQVPPLVKEYALGGAK